MQCVDLYVGCVHCSSYLCHQRAVWPHHCWQASQLPVRCLTQGHRMASAATSIPASWSLSHKERGRGGRPCEDIWLKRWIATPESSLSQEIEKANAWCLICQCSSYRHTLNRVAGHLKHKNLGESYKICTKNPHKRPSFFFFFCFSLPQPLTIFFQPDSISCCYLEALTPSCGEQVIDWSPIPSLPQWFMVWMSGTLLSVKMTVFTSLLLPE